MKKSISKFALLLACAAFFSFKANPGGEGFEIYLGGKLLTQQFGSGVKEVKSLHLGQPAAGEELVIKYYHCGRVGKQRTITIKDNYDRTLKQFRYADGQSTSNGMSLKVKEVMSLSNAKNGGKVKLFYSSSELPNGRLLASFEI